MKNQLNYEREECKLFILAFSVIYFSYHFNFMICIINLSAIYERTFYVYIIIIKIQSFHIADLE